MPEALPALSLVAVPGRRHVTLELAREAERRGFSGIYVPSIFGNMAQSTALALSTERILFGTATRLNAGRLSGIGGFSLGLWRHDARS